MLDIIFSCATTTIELKSSTESVFKPNDVSLSLVLGRQLRNYLPQPVPQQPRQLLLQQGTDVLQQAEQELRSSIDLSIWNIVRQLISIMSPGRTKRPAPAPTLPPNARRPKHLCYASSFASLPASHSHSSCSLRFGIRCRLISFRVRPCFSSIRCLFSKPAYSLNCPSAFLLQYPNSHCRKDDVVLEHSLSHLLEVRWLRDPQLPQGVLHHSQIHQAVLRIPRMKFNLTKAMQPGCNASSICAYPMPSPNDSTAMYSV